MRGKRPTVRQKKQLTYMGLNCANWLIQQDTPDFMRIVHRISGQERTFSKSLLAGMKNKKI